VSDERDDLELLEAWREGDDRAGRQLFERHFDAIYRFLRTKVGDVADDLTQQTFLGCVKGKERFRSESSFRTYLFRIARNRLYTYLRDRQRHDARFEPAQSSVMDLGTPSLTHFVAARREHRLLLDAMQRLPLDMQVALELHYWEGLTVSEIAEIVDAPEGTVKRRLQRARAKLDELIATLAGSEEELRRNTTANFDQWAEELRDKLGKGG
jgi:RNA polymerase sigma-70 factor (ECF subfamily)